MSAKTTEPNSEKTAVKKGRNLLVMAVTSVWGAHLKQRLTETQAKKTHRHSRRHANRTDASPNRASRIITSRRKQFWCSSAARRRRYSERRSVRSYYHRLDRNSRNMDYRNSRTNTSDNSLPDNNQCRMLRTAPQHIRPEKLPPALRKGSTATLECGAWISFSFS